jgi:hypothetical protein
MHLVLYTFNTSSYCQAWWLMPKIILATQEAEIKRMTAWSKMSQDSISFQSIKTGHNGIPYMQSRPTEANIHTAKRSWGMVQVVGNVPGKRIS